MLLLGLLTAGAVVALLVPLTRRTWVGWRRSEAQPCVSEEQARENAAPLTTAILSRRRDRGHEGLVHGVTSNDGEDS